MDESLLIGGIVFSRIVLLEFLFFKVFVNKPPATSLQRE